MTIVLNNEISAYLERIDWEALIQSRLDATKTEPSWNDPPLSDSVYSNKDVLLDEAKADKSYFSDHIRFGLKKGNKPKLRKICNLRNIVMSALLRLMVIRYVEKCSSACEILDTDTLSNEIDFLEAETKEFFGFNLPVEVEKKFKQVCRENGISKSRVLRLFISQYLERVTWSKEGRPIDDDTEFPENKVLSEELEGEFKFTHVSLSKASKHKFALACRGRGIRPSSLLRLMIARFIEDPSVFNNVQQKSTRGRTSMEFSCSFALHDSFVKTCSKRMALPLGVIKEMLLGYLARVDWTEIRTNRKNSSDSEFPNEEVWLEDCDGDKLFSFSVPLTRTQKEALERTCKIRDINPSALVQVMMGRYIVANRI